MYVGEHGHKQLSADIFSNLVTQKEKEPLVYSIKEGLRLAHPRFFLVLRQFTATICMKACEVWAMWLRWGTTVMSNTVPVFSKEEGLQVEENISSITACEDESATSTRMWQRWLLHSRERIPAKIKKRGGG